VVDRVENRSERNEVDGLVNQACAALVMQKIRMRGVFMLLLFSCVFVGCVVSAILERCCVQMWDDDDEAQRHFLGKGRGS